MTTTTETITQFINRHPRSLREHLDAGGTLDGLEYFHGWLVELVVDKRSVNELPAIAAKFDAEGTADEQLAVLWRRHVELEAEIAQSHKEQGREVGTSGFREMNMMFAGDAVFIRWEEELVHDEALCDRVQALLPPELVAETLAGVEASTKPYRLTVHNLDGYTCAVTGEQRTGPSIVIEPTAEWVAEMMAEAPGFTFSPEVVEAALRQARLT